MPSERQRLIAYMEYECGGDIWGTMTGQQLQDAKDCHLEKLENIRLEKKRRPVNVRGGWK